MTKKHIFIIYAWLIVLTLAEVAIVKAGIPKGAGALLMGCTTAGKILMIGLYFMHIKHDRPVAWFLPAIPVVLAIIFTLAMFPDLVFHLPLRYQ